MVGRHLITGIKSSRIDSLNNALELTIIIVVDTFSLIKHYSNNIII